MVNYFSTQYDFHNKANIRLLNYKVFKKEATPHTWLRSKKVFKYESFDLIVFDPYVYINKSNVLALFGKPKREVKCGNLTLMIYGRDKIKISN